VQQVLRTALEATGWDEPTAARRLLSHQPAPTGPRDLARLGRFLVARGFDPETVRRVLPGLEGMEGPG